MKLRLLAALVLLSTTGVANAATYVLDNITYQNSFSGLVALPGTCFGCGTAAAITDGLGNVDFDSVGWQVNQFGQNYTVNFAGLTTVGSGVTLTKDAGHSCTQVAGTGCTGNLEGFGAAVLYSGLAADGTTACALCIVNVTEGAGTLTIQIQRALTGAGTSFQRFNLNYQVVPVPGAVWLFGSALGLLALRRRKIV